MLAKEIKDKYPLVWKCLQEIISADDTGPINESYELPKTYDNTPIKDFLENFDNWLSQFNGKLTSDIIEIQDFKNYLGWSDEDWDSYNDHSEWEEVYSQDDAIGSFATSEEAIMRTISMKYDGEVYSNFLADCFNGIITIYNISYNSF